LSIQNLNTIVIITTLQLSIVALSHGSKSRFDIVPKMGETKQWSWRMNTNSELAVE